MNSAYDQIMAADAETRLGLFTTTAQRLGTTPQNVEKDFWVCWTLDALFNGLSAAQFLVEFDPEDSQALYLRYPTATPVDTYITKAVKIESGALLSR